MVMECVSSMYAALDFTSKLNILFRCHNGGVNAHSCSAWDSNFPCHNELKVIPWELYCQASLSNKNHKILVISPLTYKPTQLKVEKGRK